MVDRKDRPIKQIKQRLGARKFGLKFENLPLFCNKFCDLKIAQDKQIYNTVIYNMDDDDEKDFFEEYLTLKKLNSPKKFEY